MEVGVGSSHGDLDDFVEIGHQNAAFDQNSSPDGRFGAVEGYF